MSVNFSDVMRRKVTPRKVRVANEIKKILSEFLLSGTSFDGATEAGIPNIAAAVVITGAEVSPDLQHAKIFVSSISSNISSDVFLEFLEKNKYKMRWHLGNSLRLRYTPELRFIIDDSEEKADKIERILKEIREDGRISG